MKTINLAGDVGTDITDGLVSALLRKFEPEDVLVNINSYGGDAFEAFAIYNSLRDYPGNITTVIKGVAASAAGIIFLAGKRRAVYNKSTFMAHPVWGIAIGEGDILVSRGQMLNSITVILAEDIATLSGKTKAEITEALKKELWLVGGKALIEYGIADDLLDSEEGGDAEGADRAREKGLEARSRVTTALSNSARETYFSKIAASAKNHGFTVPGRETPENGDPGKRAVSFWERVYSKKEGK